MDDNTILDEDSKHHDSVSSIQVQDETSALGSMAEEVMDIDAAEEAFGRVSDEKGPHELGGE